MVKLKMKEHEQLAPTPKELDGHGDAVEVWF